MYVSADFATISDLPMTKPPRQVEFTANWTFADATRGIKWRAAGGDFLDANGLPDGPTPYATATATEARPQRLSWEVGALVAKLVAANTGIYLHVLGGARAPAAWGKEGEAPPRLTVATDAGVYDCACVADAYLAPEVERRRSASYLHAPALLRFDLSEVRGAVRSAMLTLEFFAFYTVPVTIAAEQLNMPPSAAGTLPSFVPPPGTFAEFTLNAPFDARPPTLPTVQDIARIFANWNSAAMISDYSQRGGIAYHGGGEHQMGATDSCGVMMLNLETRLYEFRCRASQKYLQSFGKPTDPHPTNDFGEHADGSPGAPHTYNQACEFPAAWGGGPRGSFLRCGGTAGGSTSKAASNAHNCAHRFDLSHAVGGASRLTGSMRYGLEVDWGGNYAAACIDTKREGWWAKMGSHAPTPLAFVSKKGVVTYSPNAFTTIYPYLHHFSNDGQDVLLFLYVFNLVEYMSLIDLASGWSPVTRLPAGTPPALGPAAKPTATYASNIGPKWSTLMKCFVGLDYSLPTPTLCFLTPSNPADVMASKWTWTSEVVKSHDGSPLVPNNRVTDIASGNGVWGKLIECPSLRSLVWTRNATAKGQLIRPRGMA